VLGGQAVLNNFLNGDIAEVRIFSAALSDADRLGHERAMRCDYGLTGGVAPAAPTGLTGMAVNRQAALNWLLSPGATGYNVWRSTNSGVSYDPVATNLPDTSFVDTAAVSGVTNYYRVTAQNGCGAGGNSATVAVPLPLPSLALSVDDGLLTLSWPGWANDWLLYSATNLTPPVVWAPVTNSASSNAGNWTITIPVDAETRFFRLAN
jgi:hypothetical protein